MSIIPIISPHLNAPNAALNNIAGAAIGIALRPWQEALADYIAEYA